MALTFDQPFPPDGRILARLGEFQVGVIYPHDWSWFVDTAGHRVSGKARSDLAARTALSHALHDWCRRAGLQEVPA